MNYFHIKTAAIKRLINSDKTFFLLVILGTLFVYAFSMPNEFISDDISGIQNKPELALFWRQVKTININNIINSIIYNMFGPVPFWFRLVNIILHALTIFVVYRVASQLISLVLNKYKQSNGWEADIRWVPRITSLLFAIHPIGTESVAWISGFPYVSYTLTFLLAFSFFLQAIILYGKKRPSYKYIVASTALFILSLSASEKAVVLPIVFLAFIILFLKPVVRYVNMIIPSLLIASLYVIYRFSHVAGRIEYVAGGSQTKPVIFNPLVQVPIAIYTYIRLLLVPVNLTLYHDFSFYPKWQYILAVVATLSAFGLAAYISFSKSKQFNGLYKLAAFGLVMFVVSLALTLLPINIAWIVAERYVHLGSVGFFLALSALLYIAIVKFKIENYTVITVVSIIAIVLGFGTIIRNLEWRSQDTLWPVTVKRSPYNAYAHNNMGDYYGRRGDYKNAIISFETARKLKPRYADATHNLGNMFLEIGEATKAAELYKEALEYNPNLYQSYQQLGKIALVSGDFQQAEEYFTRSAEINPDPFTDHLYLYIIYQNTDNSEKAESALSTAQTLAGNNPQKVQLLLQVANEK